jgi:hypothetical protein
MKHGLVVVAVVMAWIALSAAEGFPDRLERIFESWLLR